MFCMRRTDPHFDVTMARLATLLLLLVTGALGGSICRRCLVDQCLCNYDNIVGSNYTNSSLKVIKTLILYSLKDQPFTDYYLGNRFAAIKVLDVHGTNQEPLTHKVLGGLTDLEELYLRSCRIKTINNDSFSNLGSLNLLDLSRNLIEIIPDGVFSGCTKLKKLDLRHNKIIRLQPNVFSGLTRLGVLLLANNKLQDNLTLQVTGSLSVINVRNNKLTSFPNFQTKKNTAEIKIAGNPLKCGCVENKITGVSMCPKTGYKKLDIPFCSSPSRPLLSQNGRYLTCAVNATPGANLTIESPSKTSWTQNGDPNKKQVSKTILVDNMQQENHRIFVCIAENDFGKNMSYIRWESVPFTTPETSTNTPSENVTATAIPWVIIGSSVGGGSFFILVVVVSVLLCRRYKRKKCELTANGPPSTEIKEPKALAEKAKGGRGSKRRKSETSSEQVRYTCDRGVKLSMKRDGGTGLTYDDVDDVKPRQDVADPLVHDGIGGTEVYCNYDFEDNANRGSEVYCNYDNEVHDDVRDGELYCNYDDEVNNDVTDGEVYCNYDFQDNDQRPIMQGENYLENGFVDDSDVIYQNYVSPM